MNKCWIITDSVKGLQKLVL